MCLNIPFWSLKTFKIPHVLGCSCKLSLLVSVLELIPGFAVCEDYLHGIDEAYEDLLNDKVRFEPLNASVKS